MEQEEAVDFKLKVFQDNIKTFFEANKQLEYKAYINATLSMLVFASVLSGISKIDISPEKNMKVVIGVIGLIFIFLVPTVVILYFSLLSLWKFDIKDYLFYEFFDLSTLNNPALLKENLLEETTGKYEGLVETYNYKEKQLERGTKCLFFELGLIAGIAATTMIPVLWFGKLW